MTLWGDTSPCRRMNHFRQRMLSAWLQAKEGVCLYQIQGSDPMEEAKLKECFVILTKSIFKALSLPMTVLMKENQIIIKTGPAFFYKESQSITHWVLITGFNLVHDTSFHFLPLREFLEKSPTLSDFIIPYL